MKTVYFLVFAATLTAIKATDQQNEDLIVSLNNPKGSLVRGHILKTDIGNDIYAYQEIPYAEPPIGDRRFQLPVPSKGWNGINYSNSTRRVCLQKNPTNVPNAIFSEDCLVVNVYSPVSPKSNEKYPVLVWIHGGGFVYGAGDIANTHPKMFIDEKIVMVTLNYRLGPMGFLTTGDNTIPANLGLQDQLLALRWVHENIEAFGGNSSNVVISGESAGGASVGWHLIGSKSTNLYSGAILQSGTSMCSFAFGFDVYKSAVAYVKAIDPTFEPKNSSSILSFLQKATTEQLLRASQDCHCGFTATKGSRDDFAEYPAEAYSKGITKRIPILVGYNSEESLTFIRTDQKAIKQATDADASCKMGKKYNMLDKDRETACLEMKRAYTNGTFVSDIPAYVRYSTDESFGRPILKSVQGYSKYVKDVFLYQLSYRASTLPPIHIKGIKGVGHADDLTLLFDQKGASAKMTTLDVSMARRFTRVWANFIKYRNPTPFPEQLLDNVVLPRVTPDKLSYLDVDTKMTVSVNPRNSDKWLNILDKYLQHPIAVY